MWKIAIYLSAVLGVHVLTIFAWEDLCEKIMTYEYTLTGFGDFLEQRSINFVEPLPSVRVCSACGAVPPATSMLPCCHAFCERCKSQMTGAIECPLDGQECTEASVVLLNFSLSELVQRRIRCPNSSHGCEFPGKLDELKQHLLKCSGKVVTCAICSQRFPRPDAMNHYRECTGEFGSPSAVSTVEHASSVGVLADIKKDLKRWRDGFAAGGMKDDAGLRDIDSVIERLEALETELVEGTKTNRGKRPESTFQRASKARGSPVPYRAASKAGVFVTMCTFFDVYSAYEKLTKEKDSQITCDNGVVGGYRFRLDCLFSKKEDEVKIRFVLYLCNGDWDTYLDWPFRKKTTLILTHPTDQEKDVTLPVDMTDDRLVKKPAPGKVNFGGQTDRVTWKSIELAGFIDQKSLYVNVEFD